VFLFRQNHYTVIAHPALAGIVVAHFEQRLYTVLMRVVSTESVVIKAEQIRLVRRLDSKKWRKGNLFFRKSALFHGMSPFQYVKYHAGFFYF